MREIEGAIGFDTRVMEDGRTAVFRHTALHKGAKWHFFERRDAMRILEATYVSISARLASKESVKALRDRLVAMAFPYIGSDGAGSNDSDMSQYDKYFDELDRMEAERKAKTGDEAGPEKEGGSLADAPLNDTI